MIDDLVTVVMDQNGDANYLVPMPIGELQYTQNVRELRYRLTHIIQVWGCNS
jgi:hypothetical protein